MKHRKPTDNEVLDKFCRDNKETIQEFAIGLAKIHMEFSETRPSYAEMIGKEKNGGFQQKSEETF